MKIRHYLTFDNGGGQTSLVSITTDNEEVMIRIMHQARFGAVCDVDPAAARAAVAQTQDLGDATTGVRPELAERLSSETLTRAASMGCRDQVLRWGKDGDGVLFADATAAQSWGQINDTDHGALTKRRRRVMMG